MAGLLKKIKDMIRGEYYEPEYEETVEHDIVMEMVDGELTEVTGNDTEVGE